MAEIPAEFPYPPSRLLFMDGDVETMRRNAELLMDPLRSRHLLPGQGGLIYDLGCGYGRAAYWLAESGYAGRYFGCDILRSHIDWLKQNLSPATQGRFEFAHLDVRNDRYNPTGAVPAGQARLPEAARTPDLATAFSVFTHMYPDEIRHYLEELSARMEPGSVLWATFFAWNDEAARGVEEGRSAYSMSHRLNAYCRYHDAADPLHAISFQEEWIREQLIAAGFSLREWLPGAWCGRGADRETYQDTVVAEKASRG